MLISPCLQAIPCLAFFSKCMSKSRFVLMAQVVIQINLVLTMTFQHKRSKLEQTKFFSKREINAAA